MQWEFTNDYSIVGVTKGPDDTQQFVPTARSSFVRHFCNLTPYHSEVLSTASDNAKVLITAIRGEDAGKPAFTAHILNYGAARQATVTGLPQDLGTMRAVTTGEGRLFSEQAPVKLTDGSATVSLEPYSLLTLTTIEGG